MKRPRVKSAISPTRSIETCDLKRACMSRLYGQVTISPEDDLVHWGGTCDATGRPQGSRLRNVVISCIEWFKVE